MRRIFSSLGLGGALGRPTSRSRRTKIKTEMSGSDAVREAGWLRSSPEKRVISRKVVKAFEAWDPYFGMVVIMNSGAVLRNIRIVFDKNLGAGLPPIKRAVEFESGGTRYYAPFERLQENTSQEDLPAGPGTNAS